MMIRILVFFLTVLLFACSSKNEVKEVSTGQSSGLENNYFSIFLVRHAEKAKDGSSDPILTAEGEQRALNLVKRLKDESIQAVYSTNYKRTLNTAKPTAEEFGLSSQIYEAHDPRFVKETLLPKGENALVVGHSNTSPGLVNQLLGIKAYQDLEEDEYDKIFIVKVYADSTDVKVGIY